MSGDLFENWKKKVIYNPRGHWYISSGQISNTCHKTCFISINKLKSLFYNLGFAKEYAFSNGLECLIFIERVWLGKRVLFKMWFFCKQRSSCLLINILVWLKKNATLAAKQTVENSFTLLGTCIFKRYYYYTLLIHQFQ